MIRYFVKPIHGPWYEIEPVQWEELGLLRNTTKAYAEVPTPTELLRFVYVNPADALKADVTQDFPGLQDMIWFPDMRCGDCNGRLIDLNEADPEKRYPNYAHATAMMDRHGAWPVERWE